MARVILVTGGARSGKSAYALELAETLDGEKAFLATCPLVDEETWQRIRRHQQARSRASWHTIEETTDLVGVLKRSDGYQVVLVDCLTLWINNLMHEAQEDGQRIGEEHIAEMSRELLAACSERDGTVIFVTNEVGMGIVPDNALARRYRDLAGRCSQVMAAGADAVTFVACGIPLDLK